MAKAVKQRNGKWKIRIYNYTDDNGKVHVKSFTADTKKECEYLASEFALTKKETVGNNKTVEQILREFIDNKSAILSPSTVRLYKGYSRNYFDSIGKIRINNLSQSIVQGFVNDLAKSLSPKGVSNVYHFLTAALKPYGVLYNVMLPQKQKHEISIPTEEEIKEIIAAVKNTDMEIPVLLAAHMGLRRSEICALKWTDIDFTSHTLKINKAVVINEFNNIVEKTTKTTSSTRILKIPLSVFNVLENNKQENGNVCNVKLSEITKRFARILKRNGIDHFRFHDLRHYNASVMLALGIPDKYAMEIMGHSTNNMLKTVYQHTMENKRMEINNVLDNYFSKT